MDWRSKFGLPPARKSIVGVGFTSGRLVVTELVRQTDNYFKYWKCECTCGNTKIVAQQRLSKFEVQSCGCHKRKNSKSSEAREAATQKTWARMIGGNDAVEVADSWGDYDTFCNVMGLKPTHKILRRHDPERGYVRGNCYWGKKPDIIGSYKNGPSVGNTAIRRKRTLQGGKSRPYINPPSD